MKKIEHLAQKWRCSHFNQLQAQSLSIKFLQNSLYKGLLYPVYLFAGMRGTGKTTAARIFSAAINCQKRLEFEKNSSIIIPCYQCTSCNLAASGQHPDIIEIDAASHTGVETIRSLIENAYLMPIISDKKIYIIDEAHMLSKAAFNACLKLMEEPPTHVHFILATTDVHKVIDTIRSRSIQLFFEPLSIDHMVLYLKKICNEEKIEYEDEALELIAIHSEGSVRDALNILERFRLVFSYLKIEDIQNILRMPQKSLIQSFCDAIIDCKEELAYQLLSESSFEDTRSFLFFLHLHIKNCIQKMREYNALQKKNLLILLEVTTTYEHLNFKCSEILAVIFLKCFVSSPETEINQKEVVKISNKSIHNPPLSSPERTQCNLDASLLVDATTKFLIQLNDADKVLASILKQATLTYDASHNAIHCTFDKTFAFYRDFIDNKKTVWLPVLHHCLGPTAQLFIVFKENIIKKVHSTKDKNQETEEPLPQHQLDMKVTNKQSMAIETKQYRNNSFYKSEIEKKVRILSDHAKGEIARELHRLLPGVTEME